jgi:hypothetical protein
VNYVTRGKYWFIPTRPTEPTPGWFWAFFAAFVFIQLAIDGLAQSGRGVEAIIVATAAVGAAAAFFGRLPASRNRDRGTLMSAIGIALAIGRSAIPSEAFWSVDNAKQMGVTVAVAVSLSHALHLWLARCDRRRAATPA